MGRASLLQLLRSAISATTTHQTPANPPALSLPVPQSRQNLTNLCVDAAKATIQLILVLKQHNLLCRFSFTDHQPTAAALIILVLDSILQPSVDPENVIRDGVEMLRFMANGGCRGAQSDLQTVEQLRVFALALRETIALLSSSPHTQDGETQLQAPDQGNEADAYQSWAQWMAEKQDDTAISPAGGYMMGPGFEGMGYEVMGYEQNHGVGFGDMHGAMGYGGYGFEWDHGRLDMGDVSQMLTGQGYSADGMGSHF